MINLKFKNKSVEVAFKRLVEELDPMSKEAGIFIRSVASILEAKYLTEDDNATDFTINMKDVRLSYQIAKNEK